MLCTSAVGLWDTKLETKGGRICEIIADSSQKGDNTAEEGGEVFLSLNRSFQVSQQEAYLSVSAAVGERRICDLNQRDKPKPTQ
ncbi:hypothetical protein [Helicobacter labetoulli]|uniref:hypothetical protein n=1 Tax=Helicobacter labetoulli TaxID=2315333 RepID=UPI000EF6E91E|nr:hypothetical protein [Helicobacter labetoulli]